MSITSTRNLEAVLNVELGGNLDVESSWPSASIGDYSAGLPRSNLMFLNPE